MALIDRVQLQSPSVEGLLLEIATILQRLETLTAWNPDKKNLVNVQINADAGTAQITATIPIESKVTPSGNIVFIAQQYLKATAVPSSDFV